MSKELTNDEKVFAAVVLLGGVVLLSYELNQIFSNVIDLAIEIHNTMNHIEETVGKMKP